MQMPYNSWDSEEVDALPHQRPLCLLNSRLENRLSGFESEFCSETCEIFNGVLKFWSLFTKKLQCCLQFVSIDISPFLQVVQRVVSFVKTPGNIFFDAFKLLIEWTVFWRWQILRASVYQFLGRYWVNHLKAFILKPGHKLGKICGSCNLSMEEAMDKILVFRVTNVSFQETKDSTLVSLSSTTSCRPNWLVTLTEFWTSRMAMGIRGRTVIVVRYTC